MKRLLARWFISRFLDSGIPIPPRVQRWIAADPQLKEFQQRSTALTAALRREADQADRLSATLATESFTAPNPSIRKTSSPQRMSAVIVQEASTRPSFAAWAPPVGFGIAACLAGGIFLSFVFNERPDSVKKEPVPIANIPGVENPAAVNPGVEREARELLASALTQGQNAWRRLQDLPDDATVARSFSARDLEFGLIRTTSVAGAVVARSWLVMEQGMRKEQMRLSQMVRSGFSYFTKDLPSAAFQATGVDS
jgi:hypothetical protein